MSATTGTWTGIAENVTTTFWRCTTASRRSSHGTDRTYTLTPADAGYKVRASVTGVGPGGTTTIYATAILGPVKSATVGTCRRGRRARLAEGRDGDRAGEGRGEDPGRRRHRNDHRHAGQGAATGPGPADGRTTCTKPVKLGRRPVKIKVAVDAGERSASWSRKSSVRARERRLQRDAAAEEARDQARAPRAAAQRAGRASQLDGRRRRVHGRASGLADVILSLPHRARATSSKRHARAARAHGAGRGPVDRVAEAGVEACRPTSPRTSCASSRSRTGSWTTRSRAIDETWSGLRLVIRLKDRLP